MIKVRAKVDAVQRMQDYIENHLGRVISLNELAAAAGYQAAHAARMFKKLTGLAPLQYWRARQLSQAAVKLRDTPERVLDIALDSAFHSHEGFTRAFSRQFGLAPEEYRRTAPPLPLFLPGSARDYYLFCQGGAKIMEQKETEYTHTVFVQVVERPRRKLILQRGRQAEEYFAYCEEVGCQVWGILSSIKGALYEPVGLWLPEKMRRPGTSCYVQGVEVPPDYAGPVPNGMEILEMPPCRMMVFQGPPFREEELIAAVTRVQQAIQEFQPAVYGWQWADAEMPRIQLEPRLERGYIEARPVRENGQ